MPAKPLDWEISNVPNLKQMHTASGGFYAALNRLASRWRFGNLLAMSFPF